MALTMYPSRLGGFQESPAAPERALTVRLLAGADRVALCGRLPEIGRHRHAAPAVVVGVDAPLGIRAGRAHQTRAALIAPGLAHSVAVGGGRMAVFVLPPGAIAAVEGGAPVRDLPHASRWVDLAQSVLQGGLLDFSEVDHCLAREQLNTRPIDDRLRKAIAALAGTLDENTPIELAAAVAGLSPSRLMTLARAQLGTSLRVYRRWLRAFRVARDYAAGNSLTSAALAAGFSSSAHLSAAARAHFGIRPSDILSPSNRGSIRAL